MMKAKGGLNSSLKSSSRNSKCCNVLLSTTHLVASYNMHKWTACEAANNWVSATEFIPATHMTLPRLVIAVYSRSVQSYTRNIAVYTHTNTNTLTYRIWWPYLHTSVYLTLYDLHHSRVTLQILCTNVNMWMGTYISCRAAQIQHTHLRYQELQ